MNAIQRMNSKDKAFLGRFHVEETNNLMIGLEHSGVIWFPYEQGVMVPLHWSKYNHIVIHQNPP